jgi:catechol 2,3-dioxygenase-like lactoylglutathione lyase family enzyme
MIKYAGVNHIALVTPNMDETVKFWRDLLGLRLVLAMGHEHYKQFFFELPGYGFIVFFEWPGADYQFEKDHGAPLPGKISFDHISIGVAEKNCLWEIKDKLEAAGFWVSEAVDHGFICSIYSFDNNNIPIEFSYLEPTIDFQLQPVLKARDMTETVLLGSEPQPGIWQEVKTPTLEVDKVLYPGEGKEYFNE